MSQYLSDRIRSEPNVTVKYEAETIGLSGETALEAVEIRSRKTGSTTEQIETTRLFVAVGGVPNTDWATYTVVSVQSELVSS